MKKILVVDDDEDLRNLVRVRLAGDGYTLSFASSGEEGVRKARAEQPDLILMDVMMPGMSGGEAVRVIRDDPATQQIPVVFLTAVAASLHEDDDPRVNVGGQFFPAIAKPFSPQRLRSMIEKHLKGSAAV